MNKILFVFLSVYTLHVGTLIAEPAKKKSETVSFLGEGTLSHANKTYEAKRGIDIKAEKINIRESRYTSPTITLAAAIITLSKSNFDGVVVVDGTTLTVKDCIITSLVITSYEKVNVELRGKTVIEEGVQFVGDAGKLKAEASVKIQGKIVNGERTLL